MPLTLVTGRANSGKTGVVYGALRSVLASRGRAALLLPTYPDVHRAAAEGLSNFSVLVAHVLVPPALEALLSADGAASEAGFTPAERVGGSGDAAQRPPY